MKNKTRNLIPVLVIVLYSILFFAVILSKNRSSLYVDDNILQWGPVINKAFDNIFSGKGIPYWNFYQYKGINIFSSGYYGLLNSFMYVSYAISHYLLNGFLETLIVYEIIMYMLGNLMMYKILRTLNLKRSTIIIAMLTYSTSVIFFLFSFYYFTFNNYFFMPFLMWTFIQTNSKRIRYFIPGIVLAFSLLMGHVQFSCYYVMVYCIFQVVASVQKKKLKELVPLMTNLMIFIGLSSGIIIGSMKVSGDRSLILSGNEGFFDLSVAISNIFKPICIVLFNNKTISYGNYMNYIGLGFFAWFCLLYAASAIKTLYTKTECGIQLAVSKLTSHGKISNKSRLLLYGILYFASVRAAVYYLFEQYHYSPIADAVIVILIAISVVCLLVHDQKTNTHYMTSHKLRAGCVLFLILLFLVLKLDFVLYLAAIVCYIHFFIKGKGQNKYNESEKLMHIFLFAAVFFVIMAEGSGHGIADILGHLPFISEFRFLYKCSFIYVPLIIVTGAYKLDSMKKYYKPVIIASLVSVIFSFVAILYFMLSGTHNFINNKHYDYWDYKNIKPEVESLLYENHIDHNYRFLTIGKIYKDNMTYSNNPVEYSSKICFYGFTKNICTEYGLFSLNGYDNIFSKKGFDQSNAIMKDISTEGMMCNMVASPLSYLQYMKEPEWINKFEDQMISNGVKYVLVDKNSPKAIEAFTKVIEKCPKLTISTVRDWTRGMELIEIDGVSPICSYGDNIEIPIKADLDTLNFDADFAKDTEIVVSMTYVDNYKLTLYQDGRSVGDAKLTETSDGYISAVIPKGNYTVQLSYENKGMDITVLIAIFTTIITSAATIYLFLDKSPKTTST
ncbi:MAG TPA: hypothetical protein DCZ53_08760 [Ruminococcus sp.]|nr:hypothetical protein [Ruminococcus sp.]